jgi:hypothetical protein
MLDTFFLGELHIVYKDLGASFSLSGECDVQLVSISFYSSFLTSFLLQLGWFAFSKKQWLDHSPWLILQYRRQRDN